MFQWGCVSAANLSLQSSFVDIRKLGSSPRRCFQMGSQKVEALTFGGSEFMARSLRIPCSSTICKGQRKGAIPLKVCVSRILLLTFRILWVGCVGN